MVTAVVVRTPDSKPNALETTPTIVLMPTINLSHCARALKRVPKWLEIVPIDSTNFPIIIIIGDNTATNAPILTIVSFVESSNSLNLSTNF